MKLICKTLKIIFKIAIYPSDNKLLSVLINLISMTLFWHDPLLIEYDCLYEENYKVWRIPCKKTFPIYS